MNADTYRLSGAVPLARMGCGRGLRKRGFGEMGMLLFVLLSLASLASALLPLAAVVLQAAGFYLMPEEVREVSWRNWVFVLRRLVLGWDALFRSFLRG